MLTAWGYFLCSCHFIITVKMNLRSCPGTSDIQHLHDSSTPNSFLIYFLSFSEVE